MESKSTFTKGSAVGWTVAVIAVILLVIVFMMTRNTAEAPVDESGNVPAAGDTRPAGTEGDDSPAATGPAQGNTATGTVNAGVSAGVSASAVKTFNVEGGGFYFNPKEIRVKKGDTVKIAFTNKMGTHDWVIDEFNARTKVLGAGQTETIQFVADKTGTFEYYCSVGNHRAQGMKGNLIVE